MTDKKDDKGLDPNINPETGNYYPGKHPNSIKAFTEGRNDKWTKETAAEAGRRGGQAAAAMAEKRKRIKQKAQELTFLNDALEEEGINALDIMRAQMVKAHLDGEDDLMLEIAKVLAEYDAPKLARIESRIEEVQTEDMSKDEILERIKKITGGL